MTFRTRVAAAIAVVVAIAVLLACFAAYKAARDALEGSTDATLTAAYHAVYFPGSDGGPPELQFSRSAGLPMFYWNSTLTNTTDLPIDAAIRGDSNGQGQVTFQTATSIDGQVVRELVAPIPAGTFFVNYNTNTAYPMRYPSALVIYTGFSGVEARLKSLEKDLLLLAALGILVAAIFGWLAARAALVPLADTTREIEEVAATLDVSHRVEEGTDDELGRLRRAFNKLLKEVEHSQDAQRQLILDASHELRTPLTSLRANAQVLGRLDELEREEVSQLSTDMVSQVDELTVLVGDLTELTQGEHSVEEPTVFDLSDLVSESAEIAETHARTRQVQMDVATSPCAVHARRHRVARAIGNLLDNAIKFSPEGGRVTVSCADAVVVVEDQGPGIDDADLPKVFDRFYRSPRSRGLPGSGLGLAIVAQVAREAGGSVEAGRSEALGGARMVLRLPPSAGF